MQTAEKWFPIDSAGNKYFVEAEQSHASVYVTASNGNVLKDGCRLEIHILGSSGQILIFLRSPPARAPFDWSLGIKQTTELENTILLVGGALAAIFLSALSVKLLTYRFSELPPSVKQQARMKTMLTCQWGIECMRPTPESGRKEVGPPTQRYT